MFRIVTKKRRQSLDYSSKRVTFMINIPVLKEYAHIDLNKNRKQRISHKFTTAASEYLRNIEKYPAQQSTDNWQNTLHRYMNAKKKIQGRKTFNRQFQLHPLDKVNKIREMKLIQQCSLPHSFTMNSSILTECPEQKQINGKTLLLKESVKLQDTIVRCSTHDTQSQIRKTADKKPGQVNSKQIEFVSFKEQQQKKFSKFIDSYLRKKQFQKESKQLNLSPLRIINIRRSNGNL